MCFVPIARVRGYVRPDDRHTLALSQFSKWLVLCKQFPAVDGGCAARRLFYFSVLLRRVVGLVTAVIILRNVLFGFSLPCLFCGLCFCWEAARRRAVQPTEMLFCMFSLVLRFVGVLWCCSGTQIRFPQRLSTMESIVRKSPFVGFRIGVAGE